LGSNCISTGENVECKVYRSYFDFKQLIETLYENTLLCQLEHMKLNDTGKLRFYSKICTSFDLKQYLRVDLPKFNRSLITKIRISAHQLLKQGDI
jgi:hypothetical protein